MNYLYKEEDYDPFSRERGNGYLEDKEVETAFLKSLRYEARKLCEKFKIHLKFYPNDVRYRVDNHDKLTFLDFGYDGMSLIFKIKNGKLQPATETMDADLEKIIDSLGYKYGEPYKQAFLNGLIDIANKELTKAMNSKGTVKENYFPY